MSKTSQFKLYFEYDLALKEVKKRIKLRTIKNVPTKKSA